MLRFLQTLPLLALFLSPGLAIAEGGDSDEADKSEDKQEQSPASPPGQEPSAEAPARLSVTVEDSRSRAELSGLHPEATLTRRDLELRAGAFDDTLRALHSLPGITGDTTSRATFFVRGTPTEELRVEVDGIPLRRLTHSGEIASVFQRDLLHQIRLDQSGTSVDRPQGLAGGLYASYIDGPTDRLDGSVELSMLAVSGHVAVALDKAARHSLVVGARQSLLPLYLGVADAAGAFESSPPQADSTEAFLRWTGRPGTGHRVRASALLHRDRLLFDDVDERHMSVGGSFDWDWKTDYGAHRGVQFVHISHLGELPEGDPASLSAYGTDREHRTQIRGFASQEFLPGTRIAVGAEVAAMTRSLSGRFEDWRSVPAWVWKPLADPAAPRLAIERSETWPELAAWTKLTHSNPLLDAEIGVRADVLNRSKTPAISARGRASFHLGTSTDLFLSISFSQQERQDQALFTEQAAEDLPGPERAIHLDFGVAQKLGGHGVASALFWHRVNRGLVVWNDNMSTPGEASLDGLGEGMGGAVKIDLRRDRFEFSGHYAVSKVTRSNPRSRSFAEQSASMGDPRHDVRAAATVVVGKRRTMQLSGEYTWSSPWVVATLQPIDAGDNRWLWRTSALDHERTEGTHRLAVRWEHLFPFERWKLRATVAVAGVPSGSGPVRDCPPQPEALEEGGDAPDVPVCRTLDFLPAVMPWLGLRAEW